jgi:hypothetical protein
MSEAHMVIHGSGKQARPEIRRRTEKTSFDQNPGSNMRKTINFPKESESSFMKFVRGGG